MRVHVARRSRELIEERPGIRFPARAAVPLIPARLIAAYFTDARLALLDQWSLGRIPGRPAAIAAALLAAAGATVRSMTARDTTGMNPCQTPSIVRTHIEQNAAISGDGLMSSNRVTLFHSPNSRSSGVLTLLEELGVPFDLSVVNMKAGEQRKPAYLAVNPMGKVPAVRDGDAVVTEQVAIYIYLADRFPEAGLAPPIGDPLRGPYLRWLAFYGSCFEPAVVDRSLKREPGPLPMVPYGDFDTMFGTLVNQLEQGPYLLGQRFSAADVLWGTALTWMTMWKMVPDLPVVTAYVERHSARPAVARAKAKDAELAAAQSAA
jgi:glutathione S-transferase